jgi:hypothetical protein
MRDSTFFADFGAGLLQQLLWCRKGSEERPTEVPSHEPCSKTRRHVTKDCLCIHVAGLLPTLAGLFVLQPHLTATGA